MKLVIDIPDWYYDELQEFKHPDFIDKAIRDGVILPYGMGKQDLSKAIMKTIEVNSKKGDTT